MVVLKKSKGVEKMRKRKVLIVLILLLFEGCLSVTKGTKSKIYINTDPKGAEVIVGDRILGVTPGFFDISSTENFIILRKEGFKPETLLTNTRVKGVNRFYSGLLGSIGGLCVGSVIGAFAAKPEEPESLDIGAVIGAAITPALTMGMCAVAGMIIGPIISIVVDQETGALHEIPKKSFEIKLEKK